MEKDVRVDVRMSDKERKKLRALAKRRKMNVSELVRDWINKAQR